VTPAKSKGTLNQTKPSLASLRAAGKHAAAVGVTHDTPWPLHGFLVPADGFFLPSSVVASSRALRGSVSANDSSKLQRLGSDLCCEPAYRQFCSACASCTALKCAAAGYGWVARNSEAFMSRRGRDCIAVLCTAHCCLLAFVSSCTRTYTRSWYDKVSDPDCTG
jgi:hypothetical protein